MDGQIDFSGSGPNCSTGLTTRKSRSLRKPASTMVTGPRRHWPSASISAAAEIAGHFLQRPLRRRQADAHERPVRLQIACKPFQQQREEDAAFVGTEGVNFIDDAMRDAAQRLPAREVSNRCSDSGVVMRTCGGRRMSRCRSAVGVSPVRTAASSAGSDSPMSRAVSATPSRGSLQIAMDVVVERFQRRDVQHADAARRSRSAARVHRDRRGTRPASCRSRSGRG